MKSLIILLFLPKNPFNFGDAIYKEGTLKIEILQGSKSYQIINQKFLGDSFRKTLASFGEILILMETQTFLSQMGVYKELWGEGLKMEGEIKKK